MKLVLERQIQLAFICSFLLLSVVGFFTYRNAGSLREAIQMESRTTDVLMQLEDTLRLATDSETGGRGFIITGNEEFLTENRGNTARITRNLTNLRALLSGNPAQIAELDNLEKAIDEKNDFGRMLIAVRREQGIEATSSLIDSGRGRQAMERMRVSGERLKTEEQTFLRQREEALDKSIADTLFFLFFGTGAGMLSLALANWTIFREVKKRRRAQNDLYAANKDLEKRVEDRTLELTGKNAELKQQIKQGEESENRRRVALEAGSLGTWILDPKNNRAEIDDRSLALFGLAPGNFDGSGEKVFSRIHQEDFPTIEEVFQKSVLERANFNAEFRVNMPDGSVRWNQCQGQPQIGEDGEITQIVGHCRDVTDSKESENRLRQSKEQIDFILETSRLGVWNIDLRTGAAERSPRHDQIFGYDHLLPEWTYEIFLEYVLPEDRPEVERKFQAALKENKAWDFETRIRRSDGETRWIWARGQAVHDQKGEVFQMLGTVADITERKRAEIELKNSEEFNRSIFENSPDCVKVLELDGTLRKINSNGLCIMEIDDFNQFEGKQWVDFWENDENEMAYQAVQTAAKGKTTHFEGACRTAKGNLKYWDVSVAPVFDAEGKPRRLVSTTRDITRRRRNEREREELLKREQAARRDAEIANRIRDEFLATVSHELRAPLNSILGWARLMEKGKLDEPTTGKAVSTIVRNAESQNRLIEDLLDVSRIISGKLRLEVMTIKPINVVESALETVRPAAEAKGIKLEIKETPDVSHIAGDPNRLQQVIWNLLSNAIKFTPNGGQVSIGIERRDDYTEIKVTDTGVGIKDEFLPHVFDRFRQADASSIRKFGGLGLGLAIVRHITEMHGGTVLVESSGENKGSTFTVRLPIVAAVPEENNETSEAENAIGDRSDNQKFKLDGLLILVVDDEKDTRQLLVQALTFHGATIETAASAEEALRVIEAKNPDVLVSDIGMPGEDGYTLIRKVRALADAQHKNIPAIALTAFARAQDRMRSLSAGYQNHVAKPVDLDELSTVIASLTGRLQPADEN